MLKNISLNTTEAMTANSAMIKEFIQLTGGSERVAVESNRQANHLQQVTTMMTDSDRAGDNSYLTKKYHTMSGEANVKNTSAHKQ